MMPKDSRYARNTESGCNHLKKNSWEILGTLFVRIYFLSGSTSSIQLFDGRTHYARLSRKTPKGHEREEMRGDLVR